MSDFKVSFIKHYEPDFDAILGSGGQESQISILADAGDSGLPLYHEACIYHPASCSIFVTSNQLHHVRHQKNSATGNKYVKLIRVYDPYQNPSNESGGTAKIEEITFPKISGAMLNGGVNYDCHSILLCAQGSKDLNDLSGIIKAEIPPEGHCYTTAKVVVGCFHGIPFNSVNDVVVHPEDFSIWFTDPQYGFHQGIRPQPQLPNQVYRYDARTGSLRVAADGFVRPNGLCFSPDLDILYVTDTGGIHGCPTVLCDMTGPSHIYAFDISYPKFQSEPFLVNRRLFAYAPGRFPDGIKCDTKGNVYAGCGNGIQIWNPCGVLIGTISIPGGISNFCFGEKGVIYACNETKLLRIQLHGNGVKGALLGI
jgi:gluconolactonase